MCRISGCTEQRPPNPLISFLLVAHHGQQGSASHGARKRKSQRRGRAAAGGVVGRAGQGGSAGGGSPPGRGRWRREGRATRGQQRPRPPTGQGLAGGATPSVVEDAAGSSGVRRGRTCRADLPAADPARAGAGGRRSRPARGRRHPGEFFTICCCVTTTTAADQIDLPRHLEQRQIEGSARKKWRACPPAEIDISPGGTLVDRRGGALDAAARAAEN